MRFSAFEVFLRGLVSRSRARLRRGIARFRNFHLRNVWKCPTSERLVPDQDSGEIRSPHAAPNFPRRWNIPTTDQVLCAVRDPDTSSRKPLMARCGLIPPWAKEEKISYGTFSARADGIDTKPAFRDAWKAGRRCLVITDGFYEWRKSDKQPFAIGCTKGTLTVMAGLWGTWRSAKDETITITTIITSEPNDAMSLLHDRMTASIAFSTSSVAPIAAPERNLKSDLGCRANGVGVVAEQRLAGR